MRNKLPRTKDEVSAINFDGKQSERINWGSLFIDRNTVVYFGSFGIEYISEDIFNKSKIDPSLTTYLEYNLSIWLQKKFC